MFSKSTEIAIRAVLYIAQKGSEENKLGIEEISNGINSSKSFTAKILQKLTTPNGPVSSSRGPNGGFYISGKNRKVAIRTILNIMGESEVIKKCVLGLYKCSETKPCPMHSEYKLIKEKLLDLFETKTIQMLTEEMQNGNTFIKN